MSTDVKWMDAAALDGLPRNADCLDDDQYDALRSQARAALALRDELASVRAELEQLGGDFGIRMNQVALMRGELAECRAKLAAQIERCGLAELAVAQRDIPLAAAQAENVRLREAGRDLRLMATTQATADHPLIVAWDRANADPGSLAALREMLTPAPSDGDKEKGWAVSYKFVSELADAAASAGDATSLEQVHAVLLALRTRLLPEQGGPS